MNKKIKKSIGRIGLNKRIAMKCLDCSGSSPKEVTLCHLFDCPLWAVRLGCPLNSNRYKKRMKTGEKNFKEDIEELRIMGIKIEEFYKEHDIHIIPL